MHGRVVQRGTARLLSVGLALAGLVPTAQAAGREVRCESHGMRHAYCATGRHGSVKVLETFGAWPCTEGRSWGVETEGIWVDSGCKARFWVDADGGKHNHDGAIAAAAIGVGLLAALAASQHRNDAPPPAPAYSAPPPQPQAPPLPYPQRPAGHGASPPWSIGTYHGYNPQFRMEVTLSVGAQGRVVGGLRGQSAYGAWQPGDEIRWDDGSRFLVTRTAAGLRLTQADDARNIIEYYRD